MNHPLTVWKQHYEVRTREIDPAGRLKFSAIADYLQEAAAHHTHQLKIGLYQLKPYGLTWILSRLRIEMKRYPGWGEKLIVHTWPKGDNHLAAARDFRLEDHNGEVVAIATSIWFLLDFHTMKPRPLAALPTTFEVDSTIPEALAEAPEKVPATPADTPEVLRCSPQRNDIDLNGHLNNACYFDWIANALRPEDAPFRRIDINYLAEVKLDNEIGIRIARQDGQVLAEGVNLHSGHSAFRARLMRADQ